MQNAAIASLGLDWIYVPFDVEPGALEDAVRGLRALGFLGANCTVPLKERVGRYLDALDSEAARSGSVNTIVRGEDGSLTGYSTDGPGLIWDLRRHGLDPAGKRVLVWGAGGSARSIACSLAGACATITIANRTVERAKQVAELVCGASVGFDNPRYTDAVAEADLLINTTTLGMGDGAMPPLPDLFPTPRQAVYDLVYAPAVTPLLERAAQAGCRTANGLGMLVCQGALSLSLWTGMPPDSMPIDAMTAALGDASS